MKCLKKWLLISATLVLHQGLFAEPQAPFSPCKTDIQRVVVHNDFHEVVGDIFCCLQTDIQTKGAPTAQTDIQRCVPVKQSDVEAAHVTIEVNKKTLKQGKDIAIDVTADRPLKVSLIGPVKTMMDYLIKFELLGELENPTMHKIKGWTASIIRNTYGWFNKDANAEQIYERNKASILAAYARVYRNTVGLLGGKCKIEITIDAAKLQKDLIDDPKNPMINFYDILDVVIHRLNEEPDRFKSSGSLYNPVIQII